MSVPAKAKIEAAGGTVETPVLTAIANAFRVPELRRKILFTLTIIALYRVGSFIPVPGVDTEVIQSQVDSAATLGLLNLFSGGALEQFAVFSLGIMPYITASIIMQLLQGVIPKVEQWAKEGESGQRKITQITRYLTLGIATMSSLGLLTLFRSVPGALPTAGPGLPPFWFTSLVIVISLIAGTALIMWFGELITQRGIGNGMSLHHLHEHRLALPDRHRPVRPVRELGVHAAHDRDRAVRHRGDRDDGAGAAPHSRCSTRSGSSAAESTVAAAPTSRSRSTARTSSRSSSRRRSCSSRLSSCS